MCTGAFLTGIALAVLVILGVIYIIGKASDGKAKADATPPAAFAVDDVIEELRQESDAYLKDLDKILSQR